MMNRNNTMVRENPAKRFKTYRKIIVFTGYKLFIEPAYLIKGFSKHKHIHGFKPFDIFDHMLLFSNLKPSFLHPSRIRRDIWRASETGKRLIS